jgi:Skp family chaperone for outer membrane proteins
MKQFLMVCVTVAASLFMSNTTKAQMKIGSFDEQQVLPYMEGIDKIQGLIEKYLRDSLQVEYDWDIAQFQRQDSIFKKDSAAMPPKARELALNDLNKLKSKIINWQNYQNQMLEYKQNEMLQPYREKIYGSLRKIIADQKYTHVVKSEIFLVSPPQDNLSVKVIRDLKLKLPREVEDEIKAIENSGKPSTTPATKPAGSKG